MLRNYISPLALLALVTTAVPAQSTSYNNIDKRDCIIGTDGLCVDSIDFNPPPNNDLFAFATLPAPDPLDEFSTLEDPFATLGPEDPSDLLFSDYNNFDIFQLAAAGDRLKCTCPTGISSTQVSIDQFIPPKRAHSRG